MAYADAARAGSPLVIWRLIARAAGPLLALTIAASVGFVLVFAWRANTP